MTRYDKRTAVHFCSYLAAAAAAAAVEHGSLTTRVEPSITSHPSRIPPISPRLHVLDVATGGATHEL